MGSKPATHLRAHAVAVPTIATVAIDNDEMLTDHRHRAGC